MNKIILILFVFLLPPFDTLAQLPRIVKDSVYFENEVYVQSIDQEAMQQAEIFGYKRKIEKLKEVIHERKKIEPIIDSLFIEIERLEFKNDSLDSLVRFASIDIVKDASKDLLSIQIKLRDARLKIITLQHLNKTYKKWFIRTSIIIAIETGVIILIL